MSVEVNWDDSAQHVIRVDFLAPWTFDEFSHVENIVNTWVQDTDNNVSGLIINLTESDSLPKSITTFVVRALDRRGMSTHHLQIVPCYVIVGATRLDKTLFQSFLAVFGPGWLRQKVQFMDDIGAARTLIAEGDYLAV